MALDDPAGVLLHDESILLDGRPVGWVTSGSYGHTLGRACGLAYLSGHLTWQGGTASPSWSTAPAASNRPSSRGVPYTTLPAAACGGQGDGRH